MCLFFLAGVQFLCLAFPWGKTPGPHMKTVFVLERKRVRERDLLQVPHFLVGTLQPLQADWKGRPQCVCCFSASVQISLFGLPQ